jgi:hypothetical protein
LRPSCDMFGLRLHLAPRALKEYNDWLGLAVRLTSVNHTAADDLSVCQKNGPGRATRCIQGSDHSSLTLGLYLE